MEKALQVDSWTWCYGMGRAGFVLAANRTDLERHAWLCGDRVRLREGA